VLKERPCLSCRVSAGTYSLERGLAWEFFMIRPSEVPSSLGSPRPGHESESRKSHFIILNSFGIAERSFYWFPERDHWRWIMVFSVPSLWFDMHIFSRWSARKSQSKDWHRKMSNFNSLVCQWNPQPYSCSEKQHL
jgi:hypothetical protein